MAALAEDPQKPKLPPGATHTIVSSGTLVRNRPLAFLNSVRFQVESLASIEGVRGRSIVPNGAPPPSSVKVYQLGRVEMSPSSKDMPALK